MPARFTAALAAAALSACAAPWEPMRTSQAVLNVAGNTLRFTVERERSIPAATALALTERATGLLAGPAPTPRTCDTNPPDEFAGAAAWQTWSELLAPPRPLQVNVIHDHQLLDVMLWLKDLPEEDDFIEFEFEPHTTGTGATEEWLLQCWKAGYEPAPRSVPTRTTTARATLAGRSLRFDVEHHRSIPAATAVDLTERATRLLLTPGESAAPATCQHEDPVDAETLQEWRATEGKSRRLSVLVSRLDGHRFMKNENGIVEVLFSSTPSGGFISVKFEPAAGGPDDWSLLCWDVGYVVITS